MKLLYRLAPLFLSTLLIGCAQMPAQSSVKLGKTFAPAGAGFSVSMPGKPKARVNPNGAHMYAVQVGKLAYIVGYDDIPQRIKLTDKVRERIFDASRDMMVKKGGAKVLSEHEATLDGHPGRELAIKTREGYYMRLRTAFSGSRLYQVSVVTPMDHSDAPEIDAFINSFRFVKR